MGRSRAYRRAGRQVRQFISSWSALALLASVLVVTAGAGGAVPDLGTFTVFSETGNHTATSYFAPSFSTPASGSFAGPDNFADGDAYLHLVVTDKPSSKLTEAQPCFWRHEPTPWNQETCSGRFSFTDEGDYWIALESPDDWFTINNFQWNSAFDVARVMLKDDEQNLLVSTACGTACYPGDDLDQHVPIGLITELVFVGRHNELTPPTGWENCPRSWSTQCAGDDTAVSAPADRETPSFTATPGAGAVTMDWIPTQGSDSYRVRYRVPGGSWSTPTVVGNVAGTTIVGLAPDQTYEVALGLKIRNKWQSYWVATDVHVVDPIDVGPPGDPVTVEGTPSVTATPGDGNIQVDWSTVPNAQKYRYRYRVNDETWSSIVHVGLDTQVDITGLTNGVPHTVAVSPRLNNKWKAWTEATVTPGVDDTDTDGDGLLDSADNCPVDPNPDQADIDGDNIGDACDPDNTDGPTGDTDTDGITNATDNCPVDPNPDQADLDGDNIGDACDPDNTDGPLADDGSVTVEGVPTVTATPGDGEIHVTWTTVTNAQKYRYRYRVDGGTWSSIVQVGLSTQLDITGLSNDLPHTVAVSTRINSKWKSNWTEVTVTPSAVVDVTDTDGDGIFDASDNCPLDPNPDQADLDGDNIGDTCDPDNTDGPTGDTDTDGITNSADNCPLDPNPDQADIDGDNIGDACDPDNTDGPLADPVDDGSTTVEGIPTVTATPGDAQIHVAWTTVANAQKYRYRLRIDDGAWEPIVHVGQSTQLDLTALTNDLPHSVAVSARVNNKWKPNWTEVTVTPSEALGDPDGDGWRTFEDNCPDVEQFDQADLDGDNIGDACDPDIDGDAVDNDVDNCDNDINPDQTDIDGDNIGDTCDPNNTDGPTVDADGDGLLNADDNCDNDINPDQTDIDGDNIGDACDPDNTDGPLGDQDGDGVQNAGDNCPLDANPDQADANGNGVGDPCDASGNWITVEDEGPFVVPGGPKATRYMRTTAWEPGRIGWVNFCDSTNHAQVDPIVLPGRTHSHHLHEFFGNPSVTKDSTTESLGSIPRTDIQCSDKNDFAAYWSPAAYQDGQLITADYIHTYYKGHHVPVNQIKPMPVGLRMVAGNANATENQSEQIGWWEQKRSSSFTDFEDLINSRGATEMIEVGPNDSLVLRINFPNCWDGVHLDSPDHQSHVAYHTPGSGCPDSHPVPIPQLVTFTKYDVRGGDEFEIASGEWYTFHQDFWNAWDESQMRNLINACIKTTGNCRPNPGPELSPVQEEIWIPARRS